MTEAEWLTCGDPVALLTQAAEEEGCDRVLTVRKARLFAVASGRLAGARLKLRGLDLLDAVERFADGSADEESLRILRARLDQIVRFNSYSVLSAIRTALNRAQSARRVVEDVVRGVQSNTMTQVGALAPLARDILGPLLFRPVIAEPTWLTSTVVALAEGIYADRAFDRLPILADALQDAECDRPDLLAHCRDSGLAHVRGCWVVDLVLGKS